MVSTTGAVGVGITEMGLQWTGLTDAAPGALVVEGGHSTVTLLHLQRDDVLRLGTQAIRDAWSASGLRSKREKPTAGGSQNREMDSQTVNCRRQT